MISRRDSVSVPRIWVTFALSVLIHGLILWRVHPDIKMPSSDEKTLKDGRSQLSVQLAPRRSPPPAPPAARRAPPQRMAEAAPRLPPPRPAAKPAPKPPPRPQQPRAPVLGLDKPAPVFPVQPPSPQQRPPAPPAPVARAPADTDLASYVEARRRARGESAPPPAAPASESPPSPPADEDPNARANRIAMANLGLDRKPTFGADPRRGGGVFTIQRMAYDYAEFVFYGWNKDIKRDTQQLIEVRKGNNSDIRLAVVRRMIAIIREHEQGDFVWESPRLNRKVTLSARQRDNSGLEAFMMKEFFEDDRRP
jgi:hypothetical protein